MVDCSRFLIEVLLSPVTFSQLQPMKRPPISLDLDSSAANANCFYDFSREKIAKNRGRTSENS